MMKTAYLFYGISGAGKGTQAERLLKALEAKGLSTGYFETGTHLRKLARENTTVMGTSAKYYIDNGLLLPSFVPMFLWTNFLMDQDKDCLVFDGVARKEGEDKLFTEALEFFEITNVHLIEITISEETAMERLLLRGRVDDEADSIQTRFNWYNKETVPAIEFLAKNKNVTAHKIDGSGTIEEVNSLIEKALI